MKNIYLLLTLLSTSIASFAQTGLHLGILGGPQTTWLINKQDSNDPNVKYQTSFKGFFGASLDYHFLDGLGLGVEVDYSFQGQHYADGSTVVRRDVDYVRVPIILNLNTSSEHVVMLMGKIGPELSILTNARQAEGAGATYQTDINVSGNYAKVVVGALAGIGLGINIDKVVILSAGLRFDAGLSNTTIGHPDNTYFSYYGSTDRGQTWNIAAGLEFGAKVIIGSKK